MMAGSWGVVVNFKEIKLLVILTFWISPGFTRVAYKSESQDTLLALHSQLLQHKCPDNF